MGSMTPVQEFEAYGLTTTLTDLLTFPAEGMSGPVMMQVYNDIVNVAPNNTPMLATVKWQESADGITYTDVTGGGTGVLIVPGAVVAFVAHFTKQYRKIVGIMNSGTGGQVFLWVSAQTTDRNWQLGMRSR